LVPEDTSSWQKKFQLENGLVIDFSIAEVYGIEGERYIHMNRSIFLLKVYF
jgi:hypothetical protein